MSSQNPVIESADFKILRDGTWCHDGAPIQRAALAKLFSDRALVIDEDGQYWLQTPFEKYPVDVEDVPYVMVEYTHRAGAVDFRTNMDEWVELGPDHALELREGIPYIEVRKGLYARISRAVYYHLIAEFGARIESRGVYFSLGDADE